MRDLERRGIVRLLEHHAAPALMKATRSSLIATSRRPTAIIASSNSNADSCNIFTVGSRAALAAAPAAALAASLPAAPGTQSAFPGNFFPVAPGPALAPPRAAPPAPPPGPPRAPPPGGAREGC